MKTQMAIDYAQPQGGMAFISVNDQDQARRGLHCSGARAPRLLIIGHRGHRGRTARIGRALRGDGQDPRGGKLGGGRYCCRQDLAHDQHPAWRGHPRRRLRAAPRRRPPRHHLRHHPGRRQALIAGMQAARAGRARRRPLARSCRKPPPRVILSEGWSRRISVGRKALRLTSLALDDVGLFSLSVFKRRKESSKEIPYGGRTYAFSSAASIFFAAPRESLACLV